MTPEQYNALDRRKKLIADLRALSDGPGHTATIISTAADELEMAWKELADLALEDGSVAALKHRADGDAQSCREMFKRMEVLREIADAALKMEWLLPAPSPSAFDAIMARKRASRS